MFKGTGDKNQTLNQKPCFHHFCCFAFPKLEFKYWYDEKSTYARPVVVLWN